MPVPKRTVYKSLIELEFILHILYLGASCAKRLYQPLSNKIQNHREAGSRLGNDNYDILALSDQGEISNAISAICGKSLSRCSAVEDSPVTKLSLTVSTESASTLNFAARV